MRRGPAYPGHATNEKAPGFPGAFITLGYLDSNQEQLNQNQPCCQLHHTPPVIDRRRNVF